MAEPTTVSLGKGSRTGTYAVTPEQILAAAAQAALRRGLGEQGAKAIQAVLKTEGGLSGDVGDLQGGGSYGPTQLYWGGQLNNIANDLGVGLKEAAAWVQAHPIEAVDWSINGYLGNAVTRGLKAGLSGPALATFAQKVGQVSVSPERAGQVFQSLFGNGQGLLGATTAEAAEADPTVRVVRGGQEIDPTTPGLESQTGGAQMATQQQTTTTTTSRAGEYTPGTPAKTDGDAFTPATPGYKDDLVAVDRGPLKGKTIWVRTWDDGRVEKWLHAPTTDDAQHWAKQPDERDDPAAEAWRKRTAEARLEFEANVRAGNAKPKPSPTGALEPVTNPNTGEVVGLRDPVTGQVTATPPAKPPTEKPQTRTQYTTGPDGTIYKIDPDTGDLSVAVPSTKAPQTVNTNTTEPWIVQQLPDGTTRQLPNPNYQPPRPTTHVGNNRAVTVDADGNVVGNTVLDPEAQGLANDASRASTANAQATTARTTALTPLEVQAQQRALLGPQLLAIQNHYQAVADVQRQLADPASALWADAKAQNTSPDALANQYIAQSRAYADAALQGATPFQLQKQAEDSARMARQQGADLLNQRLATGSSLANALLSGATSLAQRALPMPGAGPIHVDPLAYARSFLDAPDVGGGADVSEFARKLLMASRPLPAGL